MQDGGKETTPIFLSVLNSLWNNVTSADCIQGPSQSTSSRIKLAHKEQSQTRPDPPPPTERPERVCKSPLINFPQLRENQALACGIHDKKKKKLNNTSYCQVQQLDQERC